MSPCNPSDISLNIPSGPSGPAIPGFGTPFSLKLPNLNPFPDGFPEDLLSLLDRLKLLIPPGALKAQLNLNFGKDVFDAIMKLLDQFMPFLMLYKFFLPILHLIICIIEVLCALLNPFKLPGALARLFTNCIPEFLNLFPIFALIIMIISLLLLIIALIEYLVAQILALIKAILRNILALKKAFSDGDVNGVLAIAKKLGAILCMFQNLFVLLAIFNIIIQIIKDILSLAFAIPPCDSSNPSDTNGCCTPDVCPGIVKSNYTSSTGTFKYLNQVGLQSGLPAGLSASSPYASAFSFNIRNESWQLYDVQQTKVEAFRNIFDAYDITTATKQNPKTVFFPADSTYNNLTPLKQAPYTIDLRVFYNPSDWDAGPFNSRESDTARYVRFNDCIVTNVPTTSLLNGDNSITSIYNGVVSLAGGSGYEDDGTTILNGFLSDGVTRSGVQASLENFFHQPTRNVVSFENGAQILSNTDGYTFSDITYTFKPNVAPLLSKNLITLGCLPDVALPRDFINQVMFTGVGLKTQNVAGIINDPSFPNPDATQQCLAAAITALQGNMTEEGVANFQTVAMMCLQDLQNATNGALSSMIGAGFEPCSSTFTASPTTQFTTNNILVTVDLNERNGLSLTAGVPAVVGQQIASNIKAYVSLGTVSNFTYDGYQSFTANITSPVPGTGTITVAFEDNVFCTLSGIGTLASPANVFPAVLNNAPQSIDYQFIYITTPTVVGAGAGDIGAQPRRDDGDISRDNGDGS